jgi:hypothetical protein
MRPVAKVLAQKRREMAKYTPFLLALIKRERERERERRHNLKPI